MSDMINIELLDRIQRRAPSPNRAPIKSERTRAAILEAVLEFVWDRDFRDLTVGELMDRVGCSRPTFYQYFNDLYGPMEALLLGVEEEILEAAAPWFQEEGDPVPLLTQSIEGMVHVCHELGPVLRAIVDAKAGHARLAKTWAQFLGGFDDAVCARIEQQQRQGLIPPFDARAVAVALNRMDATMVIEAFGRRPGNDKKPVTEAITHIWHSALYEATWRSSNNSTPEIKL